MNIFFQYFYAIFLNKHRWYHDGSGLTIVVSTRGEFGYGTERRLYETTMESKP